ncbi:general secretion pathway protein K [Bordetella ansorpii]|uniref:Type II secretion system protein K n=1 Tax=Bordetella ansorpii TaxID=288768 RepID=A0A157SFA4_9BORD|nr:type II secretion system minor pseudopilin GspK [Bordetella ansorpii]SAI69115.1 general secretion pathway protein K [Bordetella ansorpii]
MQTLTSVPGSFDAAAGHAAGVRSRQHRAAQRGSAIIGALFIVALVTILAASLMARQSAFIRTLQSDQTGIQVRMLMQSGIDWASAMLREEGKRTPVVQLAADWAQPVRNTRFGDEDDRLYASFSGRITDEQGKFNLRNVVSGSGIDPNESAVFRRLCSLVGVPAEVADRIVQRVLIAQPRSADAGSAQAGDAQAGAPDAGAPEAAPVVQMARAPMIRTLDDLRPVKGVTDDVLARLRPVATVLPVGTWINANTARPEVIAAWVPGLSMDQAKAVLAERDQGQWFINRGDFVNRLRMPDLDAQKVRIGIGSNWFLLTGAVFTDRSTTVTQALLQRSERNEVRVFWSREAG